MSAVADLVAVLNASGLPAEWTPSGGNMFTIVIPFKGADIHIMDTEASFTGEDWVMDGYVWGFFARANRIGPDGEYIDDDMDGWLYTTDENDGVAADYAATYPDMTAIDLDREMGAVFVQILKYVEIGQVGDVVLELPDPQ
jgi:hypothetical protein